MEPTPEFGSEASVITRAEFADRRMILAGYPLADLGCSRGKNQFNPVEGDKLLDHFIRPHQHIRRNRLLSRFLD